MLLVLLLLACGSNDPNCLCDRGGPPTAADDTAGTDDTAGADDTAGTDDTATVTDTDPTVFDPETDLEWNVIDGTDGDCGTPWPVGPGPWSYTSTYEHWLAEKPIPSSVDRWSASPAPFPDVWDVELDISFSLPAGSADIRATFRAQCNGGSMLLLGIPSGVNYYSDDLLIETESYAASFSEPIVVGLDSSKFDVEGQLWYTRFGDRDPPEAEPASFSGAIKLVGTESVPTPSGKVDAVHLVVDTDVKMLIDLFPHELWLAPATGLVQFDGPIGATPSVIAN